MIWALSGGMYVTDPDLSFRLKPGFTGEDFPLPVKPHPTDSLGLVGKREIDPRPSVRKILFLGDSITYGVLLPLEDTFVSRIQAAVGPGIQLVNASCPAWGTLQELKFFEKFLRGYDWDSVVIVFTVNNLASFEWRKIPSSGGKEVEALAMRRQGFLERLRLGWIRAGYSLRAGTRPLADQHNGLLMAWDPRQWSAYEGDVLVPGLRRLGNVRVSFVALPDFHQVRALLAGAPPSEALYPQKRLERFCRERGIGFTDLTPDFLAGPDPVSLFLDETHLNRAGNERVAKSLLPRFAGRGKD
jgi:lysophospholipase L1-like esterase